MSEADRLRFALKHLDRTDWEAFEELASTYLASDFPELRTIGGVGDEGQDAVFASADQPQIIVQYSIAEDWRAKIPGDSRSARGARASVLWADLCDQQGDRAESLKSELLRGGVMLDVRDQRYFVERIHRFSANLAAAERVSTRIVNPLLPVEELGRHSAVADPDLRAGLVYLELWLRDPEVSHNLVKVSYDSLVLGALRDTDSQRRMTRSTIESTVQRTLPGRDPAVIKSSVGSSLERLRNRRRITVSRDDESYALHNDERARRTSRALDLLAERESVRAQLDDIAQVSARELEIPYPDTGSDVFVDVLERIFERALQNQGNLFAEAVRRQTASALNHDVRAQAEDAVTRDWKALRGLHVPRAPLVELAVEVTTSAFVSTGPVQSYLRELADAYTFLAFMQEAPDVQRAVSEFFSRGRLVLDTSVILPCLPESILPPDEQRYTNLLRAATGADMALCTTEGVLNELNAHLELSLLCHRMPRSEWQGSIPLVYLPRKNS